MEKSNEESLTPAKTTSPRFSHSFHISLYGYQHLFDLLLSFFVVVMRWDGAECYFGDGRLEGCGCRGGEAGQY